MPKGVKLSYCQGNAPCRPIPPNSIHLPGAYVDRFVRPNRSNLTLPSPPVTDSTEKGAPLNQCRRIARRAAKEITDGPHANLGIGIPTLVPEYLPPNVWVWLQSENGILGMGPYPTEKRLDADIINAGTETVTLLPGATAFDSNDSFAAIRGGHIDVAILGAMEVPRAVDIANFMIPWKMVKGIGGVMEHVSNPDMTEVIVVMDHCAKDSSPRILKKCSLPLRGAKIVSQIVTELAMFDVDRKAGELKLVELAEGVTLEGVRAKTMCESRVNENLW